MFIIRDMITGALVGQAFAAGGPFSWYGVNLLCLMAPAHGLQLKSAAGEQLLQQVYEIVDQAPTGAGTIVTHGTPTYDEGEDRVTRTVTLSLDPAVVAAEQEAIARANFRAGVERDADQLEAEADDAEDVSVGLAKLKQAFKLRLSLVTGD